MKIIKRTLLSFMALIIFLSVIIYFYGYKMNIYLFPPSTKTYVKVALNKMDDIGIFTNSKEWGKTKEDSLKNIKSENKYSDTIPVLKKAIKVAGGKHSFVEDDNVTDTKRENNYIKPKTEIEENILVLSVPEFTGNEQEAKEYASIIETALHKNKYKGIIVDLRGNKGGDMSPMILGLSPILPEGTLFSYVDKKNKVTPVILKNGELNSGGSSITISNTKKQKNFPIAILIDNNTGSSGELTALSFKGLSNVKFFGSDSAGYTSANEEVALYDGLRMQITTAFIKDRTNKVYKNVPIVPDIKSKDIKNSGITWIHDNIK